MAITPLHSRAEVGLRAPRSVSRNITPRHVTAHYGGPDPATWPWVHTRCPSIWRAWQDYHMAPGGLGTTNGAADIGYSSGVCPHGHRYEGRGPGVRSGGNGTDVANQTSYAVVYIGGVNTPLTAAAKVAFLEEAARYGQPLDRAHRQWKQTACPGDELYRWVAAGAPHPGGADIAPNADIIKPPGGFLMALPEAEQRGIAMKIDYIFNELRADAGGRPVVGGGIRSMVANTHHHVVTKGSWVHRILLAAEDDDTDELIAAVKEAIEAGLSRMPETPTVERRNITALAKAAVHELKDTNRIIPGDPNDDNPDATVTAE